MTYMQDVEAAVCESDGLSQQAPPVHLVEETRPVIDLLRYDLG
jgi:hypothetical protein